MEGYTTRNRLLCVSIMDSWGVRLRTIYQKNKRALKSRHTLHHPYMTTERGLSRRKKALHYRVLSLGRSCKVSTLTAGVGVAVGACDATAGDARAIETSAIQTSAAAAAAIVGAINFERMADRRGILKIIPGGCSSGRPARTASRFASQIFSQGLSERKLAPSRTPYTKISAYDAPCLA